MIKKILKFSIVIFVIALITSLAMQVSHGPKLSGLPAPVTKKTQVQVGEQVDYTVYLTTNWFEKPSTKLKIVPETDNTQIISTDTTINSIGFSSMVWKVRYTTVPVDDEFTIDHVSVKAKVKSLLTAGQKEITVKLKPVQVIKLKENKEAEIQTEQLIDKNLKTIDPDKQNPTLIIGIVIVIFLLIAFMVIKWLRQRRKESVVIPPWTTALNALDELEAKFPMSYELFYVESTDILRQYIESIYQLPATERTTPEFITMLANNTLLMPNTKKVLTNFLKQADMIKFAKQSSSAEQMQDALQSIRQLINDTTAKHLEEEDADA